MAAIITVSSSVITRSLDMFLVVVLLCNCVYTVVYTSGVPPQVAYCESYNVVRAVLLPDGYIEANGLGKNPFTDAKHWDNIMEIKILEIFRTNRKIAEDDNPYHYALGINVDFNPDMDGCGFSDIGDEGLFYFDDWESMKLKRFCKSWQYSTSQYEKNALRRELYDCQCAWSSCWDRLTKKRGEPDCGYAQMDQLLCKHEAGNKHGCVWKGSRQTCVNPFSRIIRRIRK